VKVRILAWGAIAVCLSVGAALVVHDLTEWHVLIRETKGRIHAIRQRRIQRPVLRAPEVDCDARERQEEILMRISTRVRAEDLSLLLQESDDDHEALGRIEAAVPDADVTAWLETSQCRFASRGETSSSMSPAMMLKMTLGRLVERRSLTQGPDECLRLATTEMRVAQDDDPSVGGVSAVMQTDVARRMGLAIALCSKKASAEAVDRVRREIESLDRAYSPLSEAVVAHSFSVGAGVVAYSDGSVSKPWPSASWPLRGLRPQAQLHRAMAGARALLADPDAWRAVDAPSWPATQVAGAIEVHRRGVPSVPFGDDLVSPVWESEVADITHFEDAIEGMASRYFAVRALLRIVRATLTAPDGKLALTPDLSDPFTEGAPLKWSGADYFSVGRNAMNDGGLSDDITLYRHVRPLAVEVAPRGR
jgi:hypothetical protein